METTILVALLKKFWPYIVAVLLIGGGLTYISILRAEVQHYKKEAMEQKSKAITIAKQFQAAADAALAKELELEEKNSAITEAHEDTLRVLNEKIEDNNKLVQEGIKKDEELRKIKLSLNAVRLFNASKQSASVNNQEPSKAVEGNATGTSPTKEVTLADLLAVSAENDKNHLKCINQVHEWQDFWQDYQEAVSQVNASEH